MGNFHKALDLMLYFFTFQFAQFANSLDKLFGFVCFNNCFVFLLCDSHSKDEV